MTEETRLHRIWHNMRTRCYNPNYDKYQYYGGKGITVCDEWRNSYNSFWGWAYSHGYNDSLTLDRIDVDGNYCPENCKWVDRKAQANNRTSNHYLEYGGQRKTVQEWSDVLGIPASTLYQRLRAGWSVERTLTESHHHTNHQRYLTYNGQTKRLYEWAKDFGLPYKILQNRLDLHHWPLERALTTPATRRA